MPKIAKYHKDLREGWKGEAKMFILSEPLEGYRHVVVSAAKVERGKLETYIFGCDENGQETDMVDLPGSLSGVLDIPKALENAGYEVDMPATLNPFK